MNEKLAINGGDPVINNNFKIYNSLGNEELIAAKQVIESGVLSKYLGCWHEDFYGGEKVQEFERERETYFNVKHAITVNSWTSGLVAAIGALDIEPGDEIIVSPWTMTASATAILHWNAIPVFADIDRSTFCLDLESVEKNISPFTKAIMSVDIFGQSANIDGLNQIAKKHNLRVISDTAQSPGAKYKGEYAGTLTDIGGFSLNYHKHIHTGEGGILVTNDDNLAERMRLIRNHAEAVIGDMGRNDYNNMIGHNFRLGEIESAIGIEQLKKLDKLIKSKQKLAKKLDNSLSKLNGLTIPHVPNDQSHVYYIYPLIYDSKISGVTKEAIYRALIAEGIPCLSQEYQNIHLLPIYQKKIAYGKSGFPWTIGKREISYKKGICPNAEELNDNSYLGIGLCMYDFEDEDIELVIKAFNKVWENLDQLKDL